MFKLDSDNSPHGLRKQERSLMLSEYAASLRHNSREAVKTHRVSPFHVREP